MSKLVKLAYDVWPYGCKGDVVRLTDDEVKDLKKKASGRNIDHPYEEVKEEATKKDEGKETSDKK